MVYWALLFLVYAVLAGLFGFGGLASTPALIAQFFFFVFCVLFLVAFTTVVRRNWGARR